jgi:hypothetical protein
MGVLNQKIQIKKCAQNMGVLNEKNWEKKTPPSFSHEGRWGEGFFNINVNQIGHLEKG